MSSSTPLLGDNQTYYYQYKGIPVIKEDIRKGNSFANLDFNKASFEEVHQSALQALQFKLVNLKEIIDSELEEKRRRVTKVILVTHAIAAIFIALIEMVFFKSFPANNNLANVIIPFTIGTGFSSLYISFKTWYPSKHPEQEKYNQIKKQITLLQSEYCIELLKKEENKNLYPLLTNLELGKYLSLNKTVSQYNNQANSLIAKLLV